MTYLDDDAVELIRALVLAVVEETKAANFSGPSVIARCEAHTRVTARRVFKAIAGRSPTDDELNRMDVAVPDKKEGEPT